jgi:hypothetical protein
MPEELRCDNNIKFGELDREDHVLEVKCRSRRCGAEPGVVVVHGFDLESGKLLGTRKFRDPVASTGGV